MAWGPLPRIGVEPWYIALKLGTTQITDNTGFYHSLRSTSRMKRTHNPQVGDHYWPEKSDRSGLLDGHEGGIRHMKRTLWTRQPPEQMEQGLRLELQVLYASSPQPMQAEISMVVFDLHIMHVRYTWCCCTWCVGPWISHSCQSSVWGLCLRCMSCILTKITVPQMPILLWNIFANSVH